RAHEQVCAEPVRGLQGDVEIGLIFLPHPPATCVARDADHFVGRERGGGLIGARRRFVRLFIQGRCRDATALADCICTGPEAARGRFADEDYGRARVRLLSGGGAATYCRQTERGELIRREAVVVMCARAGGRGTV